MAARESAWSHRPSLVGEELFDASFLERGYEARIEAYWPDGVTGRPGR